MRYLPRKVYDGGSQVINEYYKLFSFVHWPTRLADNQKEYIDTGKSYASAYSLTLIKPVECQAIVSCCSKITSQ